MVQPEPTPTDAIDGGQRSDEHLSCQRVHLPMHCPGTTFTIGDVLHHPTGKGNVWMILIVDVLYQFWPPLPPLSLHQAQQAGALHLPVDQTFYRYVILRDTITPSMVGRMSDMDVTSVDGSPHFPWIKLGARPVWVAQFHPYQWGESKPVPFDLSELQAAQNQLMLLQ